MEVTENSGYYVTERKSIYELSHMPLKELIPWLSKNWTDAGLGIPRKYKGLTFHIFYNPYQVTYHISDEYFVGHNPGNLYEYNHGTQDHKSVVNKMAAYMIEVSEAFKRR